MDGAKWEDGVSWIFWFVSQGFTQSSGEERWGMGDIGGGIRKNLESLSNGKRRRMDYGCGWIGVGKFCR